MPATNRRSDPPADRLLTACQKGVEQYAIWFAPLDKYEAIEQLERWAGNPDLSLTWQDAEKMATTVHTLTRWK